MNSKNTIIALALIAIFGVGLYLADIQRHNVTIIGEVTASRGCYINGTLAWPYETCMKYVGNIVEATGYVYENNCKGVMTQCAEGMQMKNIDSIRIIGTPKLTPWDALSEKVSGDDVILDGYLKSAVQYPSGIFVTGESYKFLSSNKDSPDENQVPLIVSDAACPDKIRVRGKIVLREGPAGMGVSGRINYTFVKVDKWDCIA